MNKQQILSWLLADAEAHGQKYENRFLKLEEGLQELNNRRDVSLPTQLSRRPEQMLPLLRTHFNDNVTSISLVLSHYFPDEFLFYRVSKLENEIFDGFDFLAEIVPGFAFPFDRVGRNGMDRYLALNKALLQFATQHWSKCKSLQGMNAYFLYEGLGHLFLTKSSYNRYWVMVTRDTYFESLETLRPGDDEWSGRKEMRAGDLVFMYCTAPRKAITGIYRARQDPRYDPWGAWDGFWVSLQKVCDLDWIGFAEMKRDPILSQWGPIKRNFQGTVTEAMPHAIYNRLLTYISEPKRSLHRLTPEPVANIPESGQFVSEADFEAKVIEPLLRRWEFQFYSQHPCHFRFGSQEHRGRVDFYVSDQQGQLTLFENKLRIVSDIELKLAVAQARSYALMLGLPCFVVAAPEGLWLYRLRRHQEVLVCTFTPDELRTKEAELRTLILQSRS